MKYRKGMFYTNVDDYETKEDIMNDFIALRMYDMAKDKEIERLKADLHEANDSVTWWNNRFNSEHKQIEDLKEQIEYQDLWRKEYLSRIDKATEYIKERKNLNWYADGVFVYELLNILQGVDKE